ncbi:MAG: hypothetical protein LKM31_13105 [Sphingobium sp.]|nr:hypothetical protein [Sphingobium sp.]
MELSVRSIYLEQSAGGGTTRISSVNLPAKKSKAARHSLDELGRPFGVNFAKVFLRGDLSGKIKKPCSTK